MRATESLTRIAIGLPMRWKPSSESPSLRLDGAKMLAGCPIALRVRARWRTWSVTPPGDAKSYGETSPTFIGSRSPFPDSMGYVPLLRVFLDEALDVAQELHRDPSLLLLFVRGRVGHHERQALGHVAVVRQPVHADRKQGRAEAHRHRGWAHRNRRGAAEERHRPARPGDVAVDRRDHHLVVAQRLRDLA